MGAALAFLWGYYGADVTSLAPHLLAFAAIVSILPPFLFVATAFALARAQAMGDTARHLRTSAEKLTHADETAMVNAQRLGRIVRRELDTLSHGLDGAFNRMRALQSVLEERIAQVEEAGARADVRTQAIAQRLREERKNIEEIAETLDRAAAGASETLAGRGAQLKALMEQTGSELQAAGQLLDTQSAQFRDAAAKAAEAPFAAAVELDNQAKKIEATAENAVNRAEFVLGRQEKQRAAMNEFLTRLKDETAKFEKVLEAQTQTIERAAALLAGETKHLEEATDQGLRRVGSAMDGAAAKTAQLASGFGRDAEHVQQAAESAAAAMARLIGSLREASSSAHELMEKTTAEAKRRSTEFVGEAMESSDHLLRAAASVAEQTERARAALARAAEEAERHIIAIPGVAVQEAERVREAMRAETEKMLDMSARTLATLQARGVGRAAPKGEGNGYGTESIGESLRGLAKRVTAPKKSRADSNAPRKNFELSDVLAAAEVPDSDKPSLRPSALSALGSLQAALADLAGDLDAAFADDIDTSLWRRYIAGDRGVFARKLASAIGPETVDDISRRYREDQRFHAAADAYLEEFETLLARARESDRDGLLASTLLSADTGKVYLAVAYALGRLG
jgi:hypothetical protein